MNRHPTSPGARALVQLRTPTAAPEFTGGGVARARVDLSAAPPPHAPEEDSRHPAHERGQAAPHAPEGCTSASDVQAPPETGDRAGRLHRRFDRMGRLVGDLAMRRLTRAHVMVIGLGGVGSWAAEALARSGIGRLSVVDFDLVCVTNTNRQLHALRGAIGRPKASLLAERLRSINPAARVDALERFYDASSSHELLGDEGEVPDLVVDAIDNIAAKCHLIATCRARGIAAVVSGGASGRLDPTAVRVADLAEVRDDAFLAATRKQLRRRHDFPADGPWGISAVYSLEPCRAPMELEYDHGEGFRCVCPQGDNGLHGCEHRNVIYGTAGFVTGAFGLSCASQAVRILTAGELP